jgi:hypothetical protein
MSGRKLTCGLLAVSIVALTLGAAASWSAPVSKATALQAAQGWIWANPTVAGKKGHQIAGVVPAGVREYHSAQGQLLAYCVDLKPAGFILVSADDSITPVIAYSAEGKFRGTHEPQNVQSALLDLETEICT